MSQYILPQATELHDSWRCVEVRSFEPTENQKVMIAAVQTALDERLYYTREILKRVIELLLITPEDAALNFQRMPTEGGVIGMDAYYARKYIDAQKRFAALDLNAKLLQPYPGMKLGTLRFNDFKRTTGVVVLGSPHRDYLRLQGKRGANTVILEADLIQIQYAMDRANEAKQRPDNFEQFVAKLKNAVPPSTKKAAPDTLTQEMF